MTVPGSRLLVTSVCLTILGGTLCFAQEVDILVESRAEGKNHSNYVEVAGKWMESNIPPELAKSTAPGVSKCGTKKSAFSGPNITVIGPAAARFYPKFEKAGHYYVYATWPRGANAMPVYYRVNHAGQLHTKSVEQDGWGVRKAGSNAGTWVLIGDYDFNAGPDDYVEVATESDAAALEPRWFGQMYADAVRFTSKPLTDVGTPPPPQEPPLIDGAPSTSMAAAPPAFYDKLDWQHNLDAARKAAKEKNLKLLVFFTAENSVPTSHYEDVVFSNPTVKAALNGNFVLLKLEIEKNRTLANSVRAFRGGTINIYNSAGQGITQIAEILTPQEFTTRLGQM